MMTTTQAARCDWCWTHDETSVTATGEEVSPELCHACTDKWDAGARRARHTLQAGEVSA